MTSQIKGLVLILGTLAFLGTTSAGYLFLQNTTLEKDLIYYKNTDLAKEADILKLKLDTAEKDLETLRPEAENAAKTKPYLEAIDAIQRMFFGDGPSQSGIAEIDAKIAATNDTVIQGQWEEAKNYIDLEKKSWNQRYVGTVISTLLSRIRNLLP